MKKINLLFITLLLFTLGHAQQVTLTGLVLDDSSDPITGATVLFKGTSTGALTDFDGRFSIKIPDGSDTIQVSFLGYASQEINLNGKTNISIVLQEDVSKLDEVIVVGYGTVKKSDLTGSVSKVDLDKMQEQPITSVDQMIQGRASGVQITQSSGSPGAGMSFTVRGGNSLGSNQPLIVIDGYPVDSSSGNLSLGSDGQTGDQPGFNPLANLNPNDIESIEVLKDASSTAIYGSRGANGVIIITTKGGKKGVNTVEINYRNDFSRIRKKIDVLNTSDFLSYVNEGRSNDGQEPAYNETAIQELSGTNINWQDEIYDMAVSQDYQIRFSGGDDSNRYAVTGNYFDNQGIVKNSSFKRGSVRLNYGRDVSTAFKFRVNMAATKTKARLGLNSNPSGLISGNVISSALFFRPFENGFNEFGEIDQETTDNPLTILNLVEDFTENTFMVSNINAELKLNDWLTFQTNVGANNNVGSRFNYFPRGTFLGDQRGGYAFRAENYAFNYLIENTLNAQKKFKKSNLNAVVGYTWQEWVRKGLGTSASDFVNDNLTYERLQSANSPGISFTEHQEWSLASFLGRLNYSYLDKYLITFTGRADGSSRLAKGNKWSFFPSAAIGWKVHEETFMKNIGFINTFKLRASYGLSGNQNVPVGATQINLESDRYPIGGTIINGYTQSNIANTTLGWETTTQYNFGVDVGLFKNRIKLEANLYTKKTEDLIINLPIPATTGFGSFQSNSGSIENKGFEFDLTANVIEKPFRWVFSGNISFNKNKVLDLGLLGDDASIFGRNYLNAGNVLNQPIHVARVGYPVGSFFGYKVDGIYQNAGEVAAGPEATTAQPGDFKFVDYTDDGSLTADDRTVIGNPHPDYIFGITNEFTWKNLAFSFFFQGVIGNDVANLNRYRLDALSGGSISNVRQEAYDNRWTGEGTSNYFPRASAAGGFFNTRFSDFVIEDGSFVRLKNVNIAYTFSDLNLLWVKTAKIFITATNLLTITDYSGYDPEVNANFGSGLTPGVDNGTYPQATTISLGLNVKF